MYPTYTYNHYTATHTAYYISLYTTCTSIQLKFSTLPKYNNKNHNIFMPYNSKH